MNIRIDYADLGRRIRQARIACGLTQRELSVRLGKSDGWVGLVENGIRRPTLDTLVGLCYELNVSCNALLAASLPEDMFGDAPGCAQARFHPRVGKLRNTLSNWVLVDRPDESIPDPDEPSQEPIDLSRLPPLGFLCLNEPMPETRSRLTCERRADGSRVFKCVREPRGVR